MVGIRLELNRNVDENYAFFCPHALIHLSRSQPMGTAPRLSSYILTALRFGTLIDLDGVVDLETGELKDLLAGNNSVTPGGQEPELNVPEVDPSLPEVDPNLPKEETDSDDNVDEGEEETLRVASLAKGAEEDGVQNNKEEKEEENKVTKKSRKRTTKAAE